LLVLFIEVVAFGVELLGGGECDDEVICGIEVTLHIDS